MKYCINCGSARVDHRVPDGDNRIRHVCTDCGHVHYENPKMVVGCVPVWEERVLLCRRAIEPRRGYWTVPAGFMEVGESLAEAAARETEEEACARVEVEDLFAVVDVIQARQVHVMFRARLLVPEYAPGEESLEVELFDEESVPWEELAFPSIHFSLQRFFEDRAHGRRRLHTTRAAGLKRRDG
jgi:ADP-ribose pyrophosphatase YjhB (NUDIX family)